MFKILFSGILVTLASAACDTTKASTCLAGLTPDTADMCPYLQKTLDCSKDADCIDQATCDAFNKQMEGSGSSCPSVKCTTGCFPASAQVELETGETKSMDELKVGDKVRVGPKEFSEVYFFSTELQETSSKFVKITTDYTELMLTPGHYMYANGQLAQARDVVVGDVVVLGNGTKATVTATGSAWASGLYNPHTLHGDIVVDKVTTSTYTDSVHPKLAHALLSPLRVMSNAGVFFGKGFSGVVKGLPSWVLTAINA